MLRVAPGAAQKTASTSVGNGAAVLALRSAAGGNALADIVCGAFLVGGASTTIELVAAAVGNCAALRSGVIAVQRDARVGRGICGRAATKNHKTEHCAHQS